MTTVREAFDSMGWGPAPESAAPAREWLDRHGRRFGHFLGGRFTDPGAETFATANPANREELARVSQADRAVIDAAVAAARAAQAGWEALGGHGRARHLYALARHLQKHSRLFAVLESLDNGKPIRESRDIDVPLVARHFSYHAGWAELMAGELSGYRPVGVVGQIIPWNFPLLMLSWKIAPALAMGNTVVLKPAEFTPLTALLFGELCAEVGLPPGVVNVVTGDGRAGAMLVEHPGVDKIAFTGSTEVGRIIRGATAGSGKKLSLELGGKSPFIVFDDADLDSVVEGVVDAIWFNQGQVCCAGSRILVQEPVAQRLVEKLRARMETLRVGDPLDKAIDIGAIVAPEQLEKIAELVKRGTDEGATLWQPSWSCPTDGLFYPPTLLTDVGPASTVAQVEIFGPVVVLMTFRTPAEAVELANNTRYGLAGSIWTENLNTALDIAPRLRAGTVWVNCTNVFDAASGFGGYRESGFGREGGKEGLYEYVRKTRLPVKVARGGGLKNPAPGPVADPAPGGPPVDRTYKLYVGGKQVRPDGGYSLAILGPDGAPVAEVAQGNRKDLRNAVEAARSAAGGWSRATAHLRAQILYYLGENLALRADELARGIQRLTGASARAARAEVDHGVERAFYYAAWADKYDGRVHATPFRNVTIAMHEPLGVMAVAAPESPALLGFLSVVLPPVAMGNAVVAIPSERWPLPALDLYQILETSDLPAGVINVVSGLKAELIPVLGGHDDVDGMWCFGTAVEGGSVEKLSAGNMKRTWVGDGAERDWSADGAGEEFLREATQVKNIWVPYGA
ncbi:MAG: aldehyde dehydrogenase family protein [Gemmatimonadales bacterium]